MPEPPTHPASRVCSMRDRCLAAASICRMRARCRLSTARPGWLNSEPLTMAGLLGSVVLVQFWTYTCINWLRTLPYVRAWAARYADAWS